MTRRQNAPSGSSVCDLSSLLENLGGDVSAAQRLVKIYLDNHPVLLGNLDRAVQRNDLQAVLQAVHDIRGSCMIFSAQTCLELARKIEDALRRLPSGGSLLATVVVGGWVEECATLAVALDEMAAELRGLLDDAA